MSLPRLIWYCRHSVRDGDDVPVQNGVNLAALGARRDQDAGNELPDGVHRLVLIIRMVEGF